MRNIPATRNGRPPSFEIRDLGGRAFLRAEWLREASVFCDAQHSGDQEWSPSQCAGRDLGDGSCLLNDLENLGENIWLKHARHDGVAHEV
jgi:hypothetical protein